MEETPSGRKKPLLVRLTQEQKRALKRLEREKHELTKPPFTALLLLAERTEQLLARRGAPSRERKPVLGIKEILERSRYASRDTLYQLVKKFDPNNPAGLATRKRRVPGLTAEIVESLGKAYGQGKLPNYKEGAAWLLRQHGLILSRSTYYRLLENLTDREAKQPTEKRTYLELAQRIAGRQPIRKPAAVRQKMSPTPKKRSGLNQEERDLLDRMIRKLERSKAKNWARFQARHPELWLGEHTAESP